MNGIERPLAGAVVNLSISDNEDSAERGFPAWQVNRVTLQVVAALFGQGVGVIFGHDWREDGIMEAVHGFARQMQSPVPISQDEAEAIEQPLLRNLLPWPDEPRLSPDLGGHLKTGQSWTGQTRPVGERPEHECSTPVARKRARATWGAPDADGARPGVARPTAS